MLATHENTQELLVWPGPAATVRPVRPWPYWFLREKNGVAWILTYAFIIEWPLRAVRRSLGCLRVLLRIFSSLHASQVSIDERIEASQFSMAILEHETSALIGEGLTWVSYVAVISGMAARSNRFST